MAKRDPMVEKLRQPTMTLAMLAREREPAVFEAFDAALERHRALVAERKHIDQVLENTNEANPYGEEQQMARFRVGRLREELFAAECALKAARSEKQQALERTRQWVDDVTRPEHIDLAQSVVDALPMKLIADLEAMNAVRRRFLVKYYPEVDALGLPYVNQVAVDELQKRIDQRRARRSARIA